MLDSLVNGTKALVAGAVGFLGGSIAWAALSGVFAGVLDFMGIHVPSQLLLSVSPLIGGAVALIAMGNAGGGS